MTSRLHVWHGSPDAPRVPRRVCAGDTVTIQLGTWPIAPGQWAWVQWSLGGAAGAATRVEARWQRNDGENSYWACSIGPFETGGTVRYSVHASDGTVDASDSAHTLRVAPKIQLALLWHQHQPMYKAARTDPTQSSPRQPWVRLHALRDYYSMAALVAAHPSIHVTFNLTPVLLSQLDDYVERGGVDRALELTRVQAELLTEADREELLGSFFDADWHRQIFIHSRYRELFDRRARADTFAPRDLRDLQMWFNLAWFGQEFRDGPVTLITGEQVDVHRFANQGKDFSAADVEAMVDDQYKVLRAVVPIHRLLQEQGQIEVTTTPYFHAILPLVIDTDDATVDLDGAELPARFSRPEDAEEHVRRAVADYEGRFGCRPRGMWPAEGAISRSSVPLYARHGIEWIASDRGVLARSGRWGYEVDDPEVLCQPYRAREQDLDLTVFFRDTSLSDAIGFRYQHVADPNDAAAAFIREIDERFIQRLAHDDDRVVTVILDGENAWGGYAADGRPFLQALYGQLAKTPGIQTVTFSEYLSGNPKRAVRPHTPNVEVHELFTGSWIDEFRSQPGVDLGTWIGEPAENRAWELLGAARDVIDAANGPPRLRALEAAYAAEGSDWFWWFGDDQDSGNDDVFDRLFRDHLRSIYRGLELAPPPELEIPLVSRSVVWSFSRPAATVARGDWVVIRTNCAGTVSWSADDQPDQVITLVPVGGVLAGARRFQAMLGEVRPEYRAIRFRFRCAEPTCTHDDICCRGAIQTISVRSEDPDSSS